MKQFKTPRPVTDLDMAFGGSVSSLIPAYKDIPQSFKDDRNAWHFEVSGWFFNGLKPSHRMIPVVGVDAKSAMRHLSAVLRSFNPKHEHKIAGCAYLMSLWFAEFGKARQ